jgi:hypothetical protein
MLQFALSPFFLFPFIIFIVCRHANVNKCLVVLFFVIVVLLFSSLQLIHLQLLFTNVFEVGIKKHAIFLQFHFNLSKVSFFFMNIFCFFKIVLQYFDLPSVII